MSYESIVLTLGVLVALAPFSGLPSSWVTWLLFGLGICIATIAYLLKRKRTKGTPLTRAPEA